VTQTQWATLKNNNYLLTDNPNSNFRGPQKTTVPNYDITMHCIYAYTQVGDAFSTTLS